MPPLIKPIKYTTVLAGFVIIMVVAVLVWQRPATASPKDMFWTAIERSMRQKAVTCSVRQTASGTTTNQAISLDLASKTNLRAKADITGPQATVSTEEIDTSTDFYVRYTAFKVTDKTFNEAGLNFGKVLNVWSKTPLENNNAHVFSRTALGNCVVPLADLPADKAAELASGFQKNKVFTGDFDKAVSAKSGTQDVYVYSVTIQPQAYVTQMKMVGQAYGLAELDSVKSSDYASKSAATMQFTIAKQSGTILKIAYTATDKVINFTGYGSVPDTTVPKDTISPEELQKRLQAD